jgi:hypothetical protein
MDPEQGRTQLGLVEVTVAGDPAADARVVHSGQLGQGPPSRPAIELGQRKANPMSESGRVSRTRRVRMAAPNCTRDEGGAFGIVQRGSDLAYG